MPVAAATTKRRKTTTEAPKAEPPKAEPPKAEPAKAEAPAARIFNPFANAPKLAPVAPPPAGKGKKARAEVELEDLDKLAAFKVLELVLEHEAGIVKEMVKDAVIEHYTDMMCDSGKKPDSFVGVGEMSSASCEIRRRGSNMPLDEETANTLTAKGVPVDRKVKVPARLVLNPEMSQSDLMRLAEIVANDPVLGKQQVVFEQPEEFTFVTSESTLDLLAKTQDRELIRSFVERVATFAVGKFKLEGCDIEIAEKGDGGEKTKAVTPAAKAKAIELLQKMGVLPRK